MMINRNRKPTTKQINNYHALGNSLSFSGLLSSTAAVIAGFNSVVYGCGALTAGTLKKIVDVSGAGQIDVLVLQCIAAQAQNIRVQLIVDGAVVFDNVPSPVNQWGAVVVAASVNSTTVTDASCSIDFANSFIVNVSSSFAANGQLNLYCKHKLK